MKNIFTVTLLIFFSQQVIISQTDTLLKMFRTTNIQNKQKVTLQTNIESVKNVTDKINENYYSLKKGTYSKADSIVIEVNNSKQIMAIRFLYAPDDTPYIDEVPFFQKIINSKGTEFKFVSKNRSITVTKWEDKTTILELAEVITDGKKQTFSVIYDKVLYLKKIQPYDLKKNENSLVLLKQLGII